MQKITTKIEAKDYNLREILDTQKYSVDYFQREYRWEKDHIYQLIDDLEANFSNSFNEKHEREEVENYNCYYLGPIVMSNQDEKSSIIDGQQRLTSLTLLLIYLQNLQKERKDTETIKTLIFSEKYGKKTYNLQIDERIPCLDSLFTTGIYIPSHNDGESVLNLMERYKDIEEYFPEKLKEKGLPYFISWLKEKVVFVKIITYSDENAYTIFETMNDRGLNLTPSEMLKGYLLSRLKTESKRIELNKNWKKRISELHNWGKTEDLDFFRAWFRGKYAESMRQGGRGSENEDFEKIATSFYIWFKNKEMTIGLRNDSDFESFLGRKFNFYVDLYLKIREAHHEITKGLESLFYYEYYCVARSLTYPLFISCIKEEDDTKTVEKKLNMVALFIERFTVVRMVNFRSISQSTVKYTFNGLIKEVRNKSLSDLGQILKNKLTEQESEFDFDGFKNFRLHQQNKPFVRYLLARITHFIQENSGVSSNIRHLMQMEVEHIWSDKFEWHRDEFDQRDDFSNTRNSFGGLLLLPKGVNQSFNKDPYEKKLPHYLKQNLLVQSLNSECYKKNPNFIKFMKSTELPFESYDSFKVEQVKKRTELYRRVCERIFDLDQFDV